METTMTISINLKCSPFEIFNQDLDDVIMLINFYLLKGQNDTQNKTTKNENTNGSIKRVRVNDKTATGGWF